ncbi:MAG TPA: STAS domain-containing protein [Terriglobales bacterium]|nr:STAS domain-containing protein [Terriglobales bacterium]
MQLKLGVRVVDGVSIVDCRGRLLFGDEAGVLRDTVKNLLAESKNILINLGETTYIDSGGLGTLVGLYTSAQNAGGMVKLCNLQQRVTDLLQVTKLLTVFDVYDTEEEGVRSFQKSAVA